MFKSSLWKTKINVLLSSEYVVKGYLGSVPYPINFLCKVRLCAAAEKPYWHHSYASDWQEAWAAHWKGRRSKQFNTSYHWRNHSFTWVSPWRKWWWVVTIIIGWFITTGWENVRWQWEGMQNSLDSVLNLPHLGIGSVLMVSSNYIAVSLLKQLNDIDNDCDDKLTSRVSIV